MQISPLIICGGTFADSTISNGLFGGKSGVAQDCPRESWRCGERNVQRRQPQARTEVFLHSRERGAPLARNVADDIARDFHYTAIVTVFPTRAKENERNKKERYGWVLIGQPPWASELEGN